MTVTQLLMTTALVGGLAGGLGAGFRAFKLNPFKHHLTTRIAKARQSAKTAYDQAVSRGDTRKQHEAWGGLTKATHEQLAAELGRGG